MRSLPNFRLLDPTSQAAGFRGTSAAAPSTFDQEDAQALENQRLQQLFGQGQGQPNGGNTPNYNGAGVGPPKDGGFEQYISHHLSNRLGVSKDGRINNVLTGGLYAGMSYSEAYDKAREDYAALPDDQKKLYESEAFLQNDRTSREHLYQTPEQSQRAGETDAQGNKIPTWQDIANGRSSGSAQNQQTSFNPGSMGGSMGGSDPGDERGFGGRHADIEHYGMGESDNRNGGGTHDAQANLPGQRYAGTLASAQPVVQPGPVPFTPRSGPVPFTPRSGPVYDAMEASNTDKFGPKLSGGGTQPVTSWTRPNDAPSAPATAAAPTPSYSIPSQYLVPPASTPSIPRNLGVSQPSFGYSVPGLPPPPSLQPIPSYSGAQMAGQRFGQAISQVPSGVNQAFNQANSDIYNAGKSAAQGIGNAAVATANATYDAARVPFDLGRAAGSAASDFAQGTAQGLVPHPDFNSPQRLVPQVGGQSAGPTGSPSVKPSPMPSYNAAPPAKPLVAPMGAAPVVSK